MPNKYLFDMVRTSEKMPRDPKALLERPFVKSPHSLKRDADKFVAGDQLDTAINTAIAVGEPLLITGEPGTGKTQTAYYAAYKLGIDDVIHFQVKSDSTARDLLYFFDTVRYFGDAYIEGVRAEWEAATNNDEKLRSETNKKRYVEKRDLWKAMDKAKENMYPQVLLIDEIDKAPRDFPNDLLHEIDQMEFVVSETGQKVDAPTNLRPIVFITSNSERRLPAPFLRRCVYHHIVFDDDIVRRAVQARRKEFAGLSDTLLELAIKRFLALRGRARRKPPSTSELLTWLRVLAWAVGTYPENLAEELKDLPYLGVLLKDHQDIEEV